MAGKRRQPTRRAEGLLAVLLLLSFFMPWLYSMGAPIAAHKIREHLAAPHRLVSLFTSGSRVSRDYNLSICLYAVPACAILILILILLGRYRAWAGILAGACAVLAFWFLRGEIDGFPFHRLASGSYVALASGLGLAVMPLFRSGKG
jgi:hypothetical protein